MEIPVVWLFGLSRRVGRGDGNISSIEILSIWRKGRRNQKLIGSKVATVHSRDNGVYP